MRRRQFIAGLGGAVAWPLAARAQQGERMRRIGALMNLAADDSESQVRNAAFLQAMQELGWTVGRNVQIDYRWAAGYGGRFREHAAELVASAPDLLLASTTPTVQALQQATRTTPIVFTQATDPVGAGVIASLARPGGNATGFTQFEFSLSGKLVEVLKEIAPGVRRAAVLRDPNTVSGIGQVGALQGAAQSIGMELTLIGINEASEIDRGVAAFAQEPGGGLIVPPSTAATINRDLILASVARYRLPAVYFHRLFVHRGGLISYGVDFVDQYRRAASYVDRILKGEKPADLPVQSATKYAMAINLKTAKTLGLEVPGALSARADEVIE